MEILVHKEADNKQNSFWFLGQNLAIKDNLILTTRGHIELLIDDSLYTDEQALEMAEELDLDDETLKSFDAVSWNWFVIEDLNDGDEVILDCETYDEALANLAKLQIL